MRRKAGWDLKGYYYMGERMSRSFDLISLQPMHASIDDGWFARLFGRADMCASREGVGVHSSVLPGPGCQFASFLIYHITRPCLFSSVVHMPLVRILILSGRRTWCQIQFFWRQRRAGLESGRAFRKR